MQNDAEKVVRSLQMIEQALTVARTKAEEIDNPVLQALLRAAYKEASEMLEQKQKS